jgi:hypothetical protein
MEEVKVDLPEPLGLAITAFGTNRYACAKIIGDFRTQVEVFRGRGLWLGSGGARVGDSRQARLVLRMKSRRRGFWMLILRLIQRLP